MIKKGYSWADLFLVFGIGWILGLFFCLLLRWIVEG